ncbi:HlyD family efflux transporter periplasmic adaptor subunit [Sphingomonas sp. DG1-23]|uniref:efflux RND transporter periplasmic adaptor subunit n=1 Tax=Sphingomonas sp. DG1-23 TaxID=3068316 RepID=UPI00273D4D76|nr:HlyD family efflux transporter periplasmic adaptor subunit [Sphingomonas sp. DG1-23]MDP5280831.1 HlyD family efflux transporter periplasmic adaptor subunit [Sphingomonas sp. DG1-23]
MIPAVRSRRAFAFGLILLLVAALGWWWTGAGADEPAVPAERSLIVQRQPFVATLAFAGKVAPGEAVSITAPFDGAVRAIDFTYGARVAAGDTLLVLDTQEIAATRNQAEAAWLKAHQPADDIANWSRGPEVAAARRRVRLAALELARLEREANESRRLLDKGLIPRNEHEGVEQQLMAQRMTAAAANDELADTMAQGSPAAARIAGLELDNARAALRRSETEIGQAVVRAPASGVLVAPPASGAKLVEGPLHPGTRVTRGQLIGTVARDGGLSATFEVDESDVNTLAVGQPVIVTGAGFAGLALNGKVAAIAAPTEAATGPTRFLASARLDPLPADQAMRVRIGMSAAVAVITYQAPAAIVVPPEALIGSAPLARVKLRAGGRTIERQVTIGRVTPAGVEIRSGLRPGETVVWTDPTTPPQQGAN